MSDVFKNVVLSSINIYVNNSDSGRCSFPGNGSVITLGRRIFARGTVTHEVGHFVNLRHTHVGDSNGMVDNWGDGDGLAETLPDEPDASLAQINAHHSSEPAQLRNDLFNNVMSYHMERELLPVQMDILAATANIRRANFVSGRTIFVDPDGSNSPPWWDIYHGLTGWGVFRAWRTIGRALMEIDPLETQPRDILLIWPGSYDEQLTIQEPVTLRAAEGAVTIGVP